ncbi:TonB family protein [Marinimicrobium sp. ARAG 43.8]|uniref:energy transducer TonB n=1 Tax=Marinimicrobium sp. ARAG 43.8 TaxID=3418719 RepID=UPI003CF3D101
MNAPLAAYSSGLLSTPPTNAWSRWRTPLIASTIVVAAHSLALGMLLWTKAPVLNVVNLPTISGSLVAPPPSQAEAQDSATAPAPAPAPQPESTPPPQPQPRETPPTITPESETPLEPEPVVKPQVEPVPETAPAEEQEPVREATTAPSAAQSAPSSEAPAVDENALEAPVTPPRADAAHLNNPAPVYPRQARRLRQSGVVLLEVLIMPDGSIGEIRIEQSSGFERLDDAAIEAVQHWRYVPASRAGQPIPYWYLQPIEFSLN